MIYKAFKSYLQFLHDKIYYKNTYTINKENIPADGTSLLIVSNHQNTLNDALGILFSIRDRKPNFITRGDIFTISPIASKFFRAIGLLPSFRLITEGVEQLGKNQGTFKISEEALVNGTTVVMYPEAGHQDKRWLGTFSFGYTKLAFEAAELSGFEREIFILPSCNHYSDYFGIGKGGNIIALAAELYHSDNVAYLLERIAERTPYIRPASFSFGKQKAHNSSFQGVQVGELSSPALIDYLRGRGINIELAKRECKELRYEYEGKTYFVVGFPNISGGYELRNRYFKGCLAPKDITHIRQQGEQRDVCYLFEGFMDYLSFLTIRVNNNPEEPRTSEQDYMVLNSVTNLSKAEQLLRPYSRIGCFFDNDYAGQRAYENLKKMFGNRLQDMSHHYAGHKDLNDYLCHRNQAKQAEKKSQVQSARRMHNPPPKKKKGLGL